MISSYKEKVERDYYNSKVSDVLSKALEVIKAWMCCVEFVLPPKCEHCNDDRMVTATFPDGTTMTKVCKCGYKESLYVPREVNLEQMRIRKSQRSSEPIDVVLQYGEVDSSVEIINVFDKFGEEAEIAYCNSGIHKMAFSDREECQKFCEWVSKKKKEKQK